MLIQPPAKPGVQQLLSQLGRDPDVRAWLEETRQNLLEALSQAPEETRLRQLQGAAWAMKELIAIFNRTP